MPVLKVYDNSRTHAEVLEVPTGTALVHFDKIFTFGCKAGACGKCQVEVLSDDSTLAAPNPREARGLRLFAAGNAKIRLPCQMKMQSDCELIRKNNK